jgi:hypothetical protein
MNDLVDSINPRFIEDRQQHYTVMWQKYCQERTETNAKDLVRYLRNRIKFKPWRRSKKYG